MESATDTGPPNACAQHVPNDSTSVPDLDVTRQDQPASVNADAIWITCEINAFLRSCRSATTPPMSVKVERRLAEKASSAVLRRVRQLDASQFCATSCIRRCWTCRHPSTGCGNREGGAAASLPMMLGGGVTTEGSLGAAAAPSAAGAAVEPEGGVTRCGSPAAGHGSSYISQRRRGWRSANPGMIRGMEPRSSAGSVEVLLVTAFDDVGRLEVYHAST
jgi:hypothetical protein